MPDLQVRTQREGPGAHTDALAVQPFPLNVHPPDVPGGYAIELHLEVCVAVEVGRLGRHEFPAGTYVYLGSARGPGGLRARLARHLRSPGEIRPHWHIDYLRQYAHIVALAWLAESSGAPADLECRWSQSLALLAGAVFPVPGFGATDCRSGCPAHLVGFTGEPFAIQPGVLRSPGCVERLASAAGRTGAIATWSGGAA